MSTTVSLPHRDVSRPAPFSRVNKVGLVLAGVLGAVDLTSLANPTPSDQVGPPLGILVIDTVLGVITVVAVVLAFVSRRRGLVRLAAGARIASMVTALPAFFAGVPAFLVALVAVLVVVTVTSVVMMLLPARRTSLD